MKKFLPIVLILFVFLVVMSIFLISKLKNKTPQVNLESNQNKQTVSQKTEIFSDRYLEYSMENFEKNKGKKKVLFFSAVWCPTCTLANADIREQINDIPENLVILKVDYNIETELKEKYGITYQHTFVYVDDNGQEIAKWVGGALAEILEKTN